MNVDISEIKNLKIIPSNYESATVCDVLQVTDNTVKINLPKITQSELEDYKNGSEVEFFGLHKNGLVYFKSEILDKENKTVSIIKPVEYKEIQRRKYSRVAFDGKLEVQKIDNENLVPEDISAGGIRFYSKVPFNFDINYDVKIELANNLTINCVMQPIRVEKIEGDNAFMYSISMKFDKIRSIDRIALMQYSLRHISEMQNMT